MSLRHRHWSPLGTYITGVYEGLQALVEAGRVPTEDDFQEPRRLARQAGYHAASVAAIICPNRKSDTWVQTAFDLAWPYRQMLDKSTELLSGGAKTTTCAYMVRNEMREVLAAYLSGWDRWDVEHVR